MQTKTAQLCDFRWVCWKTVTPVASTDIHFLKLSKSLNGPSVRNNIKHLHNWELIHFDPYFTNKTALVPIHLGFTLAFQHQVFTMVIVTRERALYILYCKPYKKTNVERFSKIIDDLKNVEICYCNDPKRPFLQCTRTIYSGPFKIHTKVKANLQMELVRNKRYKKDKN